MNETAVPGGVDEAGLDLDALRQRGRLAPRLKLEPLMARWPLWPHLLAPAPYAFNLAFRLIPLLESFLQRPKAHAAACKDPALFGGPFVALAESALDEVSRYLAQLRRQHAALLRFAEDFKSFDKALQQQADGYALDQLYADLPASLSGLVELLYDLHNHPTMRLFEDLLYASPLDISDAQSVCLHLQDDDQRPFFLSTPLLDAPDRLFIHRRFDDPLLAEVLATRWRPGLPESLLSLIAQSSVPRATLRQMFITEALQRQQPDYRGDGLRMRYFGHACVLIQSRDTAVLIDPVTAWQRQGEDATLCFDDLPDHIDYVLISHAHQDHLVAETLLQLRERIGTVVVPANDRGNLADPSLRLMLQQLGFRSIRSMEPFERLPIAGGEIVSLPFVGEHGGLDIASKHSLLLRCQGRSILFMVDSDAVDPRLTERLVERIGPVDILFVGMECCGAPVSWLYGPLLPEALSRRNDQSRRFSGSNCERAWAALQALGSRQVFVYAMGQEPWMKHLMGLAYEPDSPQLLEIREFLRRCEAAGISARSLKGCYEEVFAAAAPEPGERRP
ncbi:MBL fold metallo-hydrolase [Paucibacter sp. APW11]|uniref:MBL fold metallo-hydrolase n=1 Tax=Roseateles aquae TaxID=3077235 RepID=A0ABU3P979_9BURK|nr:MBL fold metallo-hydrolase [Paucibacter sp. APW11]MDT8999132.1 MBL fold metallo-hydrolase [Paucibacter sp. APW11]